MMNFHHFTFILIFNLVIKTLCDCPKGYLEMEGSGSGSINRTSTETIDECGEHCSRDDDCKSFEFHQRSKQCSLDTLIAPSGEVSDNQIFCSKLCKFIRLFTFFYSFDI